MCYFFRICFFNFFIVLTCGRFFYYFATSKFWNGRVMCVVWMANSFDEVLF